MEEKDFWDEAVKPQEERPGDAIQRQREAAKQEGLVVTTSPQVELGMLRANEASGLVSTATEIANQLAAVIDNRQLYSLIQGKKYVKCEGWTTLAAMMGVVPQEVSNIEHEGGSFEAVVELVRLKDGAKIGRASGYCGTDESTWKGRAKYARRSMAATRATGKACRLAFSWIMALAGYEATPAEEIPDHSPPTPTKTQPAAPSKAGAVIISEPQRRRLYAISKGGVWTDEEVAKLLEKFGYTSTRDIRRSHYEAICNCVTEAREPTVAELGEGS